MVKMKKNKIAISDQIRVLKNYFPDSQIQHNKNKGFTWLGKLKSSPLGDTYTIKIVFDKRIAPAIINALLAFSINFSSLDFI